MGAGHSYDYENHMLIDDNIDLTEDGDFNDGLLEIFDSFEYTKAGWSRNNELIETGHGNRNEVMQFHKEIKGDIIAFDIDLGVMSDQYNSLLLAKLPEYFEDEFDNFEFSNDGDYKGYDDTEEIVGILENYSATNTIDEADIIIEISDLASELENIHRVEPNSEYIKDGYIDLTESVENLRDGLTEFSKKAENAIKIFELGNETKEKVDEFKEKVDELEKYMSAWGDELATFERYNELVNTLIDKSFQIRNNINSKIIMSVEETLRTAQIEISKAFNRIILENTEGRFRHSTSAWTSQTADVYDRDEIMEEVIKEDESLAKIYNNRIEKKKKKKNSNSQTA